MRLHMLLNTGNLKGWEMMILKRLTVLAVLFCCTPVLAVCLPEMSMEQLGTLRLPDVEITSVAHHGHGSDGEPPAETPAHPGVTAGYIKVDGFIGGSIGFELLLPDSWNERFIMGGGGGFSGTIQNAARKTVDRGYATVGTDTGHQWPVDHEGNWALDNVEAQLNFGYLAVHRTAEVAKAIIRAYYGSDPKYSYFMGCSRGGGQALMEAQRYPHDFDGIVSGAPAFDWTGSIAAFHVRIAQLMYPNPDNLETSVVGPDTLAVLAEAVMEQCDGIDGVEDGIIDEPCDCEFQPARVNGLTPEQQTAIQFVYDGLREGDKVQVPGMPVGTEGSAAGWGGWFIWLSGPATDNLRGVPTLGYSFSTSLFKYFVFDDPDWDYSTYDISNWREDTHRMGTFLDSTDPDLSELRDRDGKLIIWHGWSDAALSALATIGYYEQVKSLDPDAESYCRLFLLPGVQHCGGGAGADHVDWIDRLVDWVENDIAPDRVIATKYNAKREAVKTRPIYPYPQRAKYKGTGYPDKAENYVLAEP